MFKGIRKVSGSCSEKSEEDSEKSEEDSSSEESTKSTNFRISKNRKKQLNISLPRRPVNYKVRGGSLPGVTKAHVLEHTRGRPYTADSFGRIGNVKVDIRSLRGGDLIVSDLKDNPVFEMLNLGDRQGRNIFPAIYHLITSNGITCLEHGKYSAEECEAAIQAYRKLIEASCLKPHKCAKYNVLYGNNNVALAYDFIVYNDPDELIEMLDIIRGSFEAGNNDNSRMRKKSIAIIEQLYKTGAIEHDEYVQLFNNFAKAN